MSGVYKVESQHVLSIKSKSNVCIKSPGRVKNIKLDAGFWGYLWTCPMTIKWDAEHPDSNTCAEQWHYNVDFRLNNDRCSSDDFLNRDDGSIDMIVYKVEGPRSNLGGNIIDLIDGEPKRLRMTSKPNETDSQTNIYIEVVNRIYGKTKSMLDWPLYTPSPNRECL